MELMTNARPHLHLVWSNPEVVRMAMNPIPLTKPRYRDVREDRLLLDVEAIRQEAAPLLKHAKGAPTVFLSIDPRAPVMAVFRHRAPDEVWPINFRVAADVHGPTLAKWLDDHERDLDRIIEIMTSADEMKGRRDPETMVVRASDAVLLEVETELALGRLQGQLAILETASLRTPQQWLSSSLIAHDHYDLPTLDYSKATRIGILGIGAVMASSTDAEVYALAEKSIGMMKGVELDEGTALPELVQMFAELRVILAMQDETETPVDGYLRHGQ